MITRILATSSSSFLKTDTSVVKDEIINNDTSVGQRKKKKKEKNLPSLSFITIHDDIDIADPSSMQDACHIRTQ